MGCGTTHAPPPFHSMNRDLAATAVPYLFRGHERSVALVANAFEGSPSSSAVVAPAPPGLQLPHVGAARRAHQLQAAPAVVPPALERGKTNGRENGRKQREGRGRVVRAVLPFVCP